MASGGKNRHQLSPKSHFHNSQRNPGPPNKWPLIWLRVWVHLKNYSITHL